MGGCLAQKDRELIVERAGHVDVVFGTHNLAHAASLLERARFEGPVVEILEEHEAYPSALPARRDRRHSAWVTIQVGCDNSCTFCIVPIVRGPEISRRMGDIVHEVEELAADGVREITVLGQNVNSYGRDLGAGQYRPQFADLLRALDAVDGIDRIRFTSPHPKDLRPETIAAMAECGAVCEHLHLPLQSGSDRTLARMHRGYTAERYLSRLADARAAIPDLAVTTDIIVGFPGETDDDFARTLEVVDAAAYDAAYTFVFSPRPGTPAADMTDDFVAPEVAQERMQPAHRGGRAPRAGEARGARRAHRGRCWSRARRRRTRRCGRAAPARTSSCTSHRACSEPEVGGTRRRRRHLRRAALAARRPARASSPPRARPASASPSSPRLRDRDRRTSRSSAPPLRASRRSRSRWPRAFGDVEIVSIDSMQVYRGLDIGTAKPTAGRARRGPAPPDRRRRPDRRVVGGAVPARSARRGRRHRGARASARCSSAAPASTCRR